MVWRRPARRTAGCPRSAVAGTGPRHRSFTAADDSRARDRGAGLSALSGTRPWDRRVAHAGVGDDHSRNRPPDGPRSDRAWPAQPDPVGRATGKLHPPTRPSSATSKPQHARPAQWADRHRQMRVTPPRVVIAFWIASSEQKVESTTRPALRGQRPDARRRGRGWPSATVRENGTQRAAQAAVGRSCGRVRCRGRAHADRRRPRARGPWLIDSIASGQLAVRPVRSPAPIGGHHLKWRSAPCWAAVMEVLAEALRPGRSSQLAPPTCSKAALEAGGWRPIQRDDHGRRDRVRSGSGGEPRKGGAGRVDD